MQHFKRITVIYIFLTFMMSLCLISVYRVSVSEKAKTVLSGQYTRSITVAQRRGIIYDRKMEMLNARTDGYICLVNPLTVQDAKKTAGLLAAAAGIPESETVEKFLTRTPFILNVSDADTLYGISGVYCFPKYSPYRSKALHTVGYTDIDGRGVTGAESVYNAYLSKSLSGKITYSYTADAAGRPLPESGSILLDDGYTEFSGVALTIDGTLQEICENIASKHIDSGAVVVLDIENGEILASVSLPGYSESNISEHLKSDRGELLNRCNLFFTPGSIFKTVIAAAALSENQSFYESTYECKGYYELSNGKRLSCHKKSGHGKLTMKEAYAQSCNPYFINLAFSIKQSGIEDTAEKMGLSGVADNLREINSKDTEAYEGFLANIAIGQGPLLITPTQAASMFACASKGKYAEPSTLFCIFKNGNVIKSESKKSVRVISENVCEKLREMMSLCVTDGLGKSANPSLLDGGGKTATAQTGRIVDGKEICNTWFCGAYPISEPLYSISVLCDSGSEKNDVKAVYREICEYLSTSSGITATNF